jgi:hypothetical protein
VKAGVEPLEPAQAGKNAAVTAMPSATRPKVSSRLILFLMAPR